MEKKTGVISIKDEKATVTFERRLLHPIEKVWEAITDPEKRAAWYGPATIETRVGGMIETVAEGPPAPVEMRRSKGEILVWDPPRVFEYTHDQVHIGSTVVRFELTADGDHTILQLTNSGLKPEDAGGYAPGWHAFLYRLESYINGEELPEWDEIYGTVQEGYKA